MNPLICEKNKSVEGYVCFIASAINYVAFKGSRGVEVKDLPTVELHCW